MSNEVRKALMKMRKLLAVPERWTKGAYARGASGRKVQPYGRAAQCFCLLGAASRVDGVEEGTFWTNTALCRAAGNPAEGLADWNDAPKRTHADVLALLDRAIAAQDPTP